MEDYKLSLSELGSFGADIAELSIDSILEEGLLKDIPIVGGVAALFKTGKNVKDYFALKKLQSFVYGLSSVSEVQAGKMKAQIADPQQWNELGCRVLLIVDKTDALQKATLIGKALNLIGDGVDARTYLRLCSMIDKCFYEDLYYLLYFDTEETVITSNNKNIPITTMESLFANGFISDCGLDAGDATGENSGTRFFINEYGNMVKSLL